MKKYVLAAVLGALLTCSSLTAAAPSNDYIMTPGDQLQIYVLGHPDISSTRANSDSSYTVRPDGKLDFPLVGEIDISEYIINPKITVNVAKLGTTRVFVLGEVKNQGMYELSKSHRVLDALGAAGGFTEKAAKKNIFLVRNRGTAEENVQKLNILNYMKKGDLSQNLVLHEGDCLFLTSNHKVTLADALLFVSRITDAWSDAKYIKNN